MSNIQRDGDKAAEWAKRVLQVYEVASKARASVEAVETASKRASEIYRALEKTASNANARAYLEAAEEALKRHELDRSLEAAGKVRASLEAAEEASRRASEIYRMLEAASNASATQASLEAAEEASKRASKTSGGASSSTTLRILEWLQQSSTFREMVYGASLGFDFEPVHRYQTFKRSDLEAVLSDWLTVGDDLRRAMREFDDRAPRAEESSEQGRPNEQAIGREGRDLARTS
jgi:hypothetical protein